jgi:hypothetical protein
MGVTMCKQCCGEGGFGDDAPQINIVGQVPLQDQDRYGSRGEASPAPPNSARLAQQNEAAPSRDNTDSSVRVAGSDSLPYQTTSEGIDNTCTMEFQVPGEENREVVFSCRPLGMDFSKTMPATIKGTSAGSHAESLGVQAGWIIIKINGEDTSNLEIPGLIEKMKLACKSLKVIGGKNSKQPGKRSSSQASSGNASDQ